LDQIFGVLFISSHTKSQTKHRTAVTLHQRTKGALISLASLFGGR
jgi:hypothetical protein